MTVAPNTAMRAAFGRSGLKPEDAKLDLALAEYLNVTDGDVDRLQRRVNIAIDKLSGKGHRAHASNGQSNVAQPRQPVEDDKGQQAGASNGLVASAESSSPNRDGNGQIHPASNGQLPLAAPVREPSPAQRAASAKVETASARAALTVLDRMKTSDGKAWGDVCAHELAGMQRDGTMAKAVSDWIGPLTGQSRFKPIRQLMNATQFELVLVRVKGQNDAA